MGNFQYDDPSYLCVRTERTVGAFSASVAGTAFAGSTLQSYTKMAIVGAQIVVGSGGSVAGTRTLAISRLGASGTLSIFQNFSCTLQATTSAAGQVFDFSLTSPATLESVGVAGVISASSATAADAGCVLRQIIWRYKILPYSVEL